MHKVFPSSSNVEFGIVGWLLVARNRISFFSHFHNLFIGSFIEKNRENSFQLLTFYI